MAVTENCVVCISMARLLIAACRRYIAKLLVKSRIVPFGVVAKLLGLFFLEPRNQVLLIELDLLWRQNEHAWILFALPR